MRNRFVISVFVLLGLHWEFIEAQNYRQITLPDSAQFTLFDNQDVVIGLKTQEVVEGKLFLLTDSFFVHNNDYSQYSRMELEMIRAHGISIDDNVMMAEQLKIIKDSIVVPLGKIHAFTEIESILIKTKKIKKPVPSRRVNISFGTVASLMSSANEISAQMAAFNLNDDQYESVDLYKWLLVLPYRIKYDNRTEYPKTTKSQVFFDFDVGGFISPKHGIMFNFSFLDNFKIEGFEELGRGEYHEDNGLSYEHRYWNYGNYLSISMERSALSLAYVFAIANQRVNFIIGPSMLTSKINSSTESARTENLFGAFIGGSVNLVHQKWWFVNAKAYYRWFPKMSLGPYSVSGTNQDGVEQTSTFEAVDFPMSALTIGISVGLRF